jgi:valyl-tRNA synthetase
MLFTDTDRGGNYNVFTTVRDYRKGTNYMKLPKIYEPQQYEQDIYALWEKESAFAPKKVVVNEAAKAGKGKSRGGMPNTFSIVIPPPNANGNLHLGHALTLGVEDIAIRYHRLKGDSTLFLPGADHAGFETQVVYEKELAKTGKSRFDFTREELYSQVWDFVAQNRTNFEDQIRRIGASVDWDHYTFTLDEKIVKRAYATFKKMWEDELIYRGERLVNFCTFHGTAFADIEVEHKEEKSHLWYLRYPVVSREGAKEEEIVVATTRPETMFGDTAVAVHPEDKRYKNLIGKTVKLPLTNREIPIIADDFVDPKFGTGAVKITPAHDPNDFEAGERHDLPKITVIDHEGKLNHEVPEAYHGMEVLKARKKVADDLEQEGFLVKTEDYIHNVGHCYKCGTVIQPLLREQWFIDMQPLTKPAIEALEANKITFQPAGKRDQLVTYLKGLRDWNISRQIAWGIPIPAFQNVDDHQDWVFDERTDKEEIEVEGKTYRRDPDVFDTWFSSGSWPFATLDFPDGDDFKNYYPLSVMETGADILYPWVSRMIMLGLYITGEVPFKSVYLHGLVLDEHGQKMSKSKGNVINPMGILEEYGSDALRMGIITGTSAGSNQPFGVSKVIGARNFANKLWNIARYVEDQTEDIKTLSKIEARSSADHWVLSKLQQCSTDISSHLEEYRFAEAYDLLYHFIWDDVADWYIEAAKTNTNKELLAYVLQSVLQLAHPFAPFVTETIWQTLPWDHDALLVTSSWPAGKDFDEKAAQTFEDVKEIVVEIRYLNRIFKVTKPTLYHRQADSLLSDNAELLTRLGRLEGVVAAPANIKHGVHLTQSKHVCWLDISAEKQQGYARDLTAQYEAQNKTVTQLEARMTNKQYVDNAPKQVVAQTEAQLEAARKVLENIATEQARFSA